MTAETVIVRAAGDRQLEALASGPTGGLTLVLHNGTPAGLMAAPAIAAAAAERGLRLVLYARPGYESSTPVPGRRVGDAAADLAAVLDALGAGEFDHRLVRWRPARAGLRRTAARPVPCRDHHGRADATPGRGP